MGYFSLIGSQSRTPKRPRSQGDSQHFTQAGDLVELHAPAVPFCVQLVAPATGHETMPQALLPP
jgi:hypothetical protein